MWDVPKKNPRSFSEAISIMWNIATLGCRGPRHLRKYMICQCVLWVIFMIFWVSYNGGLVPQFLKAKKATGVITPDVSVLEYFPEIGGDGSKVIWGCQLNSKESLEQSLTSNIMMLEGDVMLQGQGTDEQRMIPVMANPPQTTGDLNLEQWLGIAATGRKGVKLEFKSIEAVEISIQKLNAIREKLTFPVWLHADVLDGPNSALLDTKIVDINRYIRLISSTFPTCTISLGWKTGWSADGNNYGYDWTMVKRMHDFVDKWKMHQPITYSVRAGHLVKSIAQVKWLMEMTEATLTVWAEDNDQVSINDLLYIRYKFPTDKVFFDLPESLKLQFDPIKDEAEKRITDEKKSYDSLSFRATDWKIVQSHQGESIFLGTEAVLLHRGMLITHVKHNTESAEKPLTIRGRVDFIERHSEEGDKAPAADEDQVQGVEIFLYATPATRMSSLSGIKCFIGLDGTLRISTQSIPGTDLSKDAVTFGKSDCADFEITNKGGEKISMVVTRPQDCSAHIVQEITAGSVELPITDLKQKLEDGGHIAIRVQGNDKFAAFRQFKIEH